MHQTTKPTINQTTNQKINQTTKQTTMKQELNLEADDLQITPHLKTESLPQMLQECLLVAKTTTKDGDTIAD